METAIKYFLSVAAFFSTVSLTASPESCGLREGEYFLDLSKASEANFLVLNNPQKFVFKADFDFKSIPQVMVTKEYGSFECEIRAVKALWTDYNTEASAAKRGCYLVEFWWMPGSDLSGCHFEVTVPGRAPVLNHLYMSY